MNANRIGRRIGWTLFISILTLAVWINRAQALPDKPNILFIMVDDLGPEWIGCYGAEEIETPHIDRLAKEGLLFTNAYSMPKCTPTRATLLTGQYPFRHGWVNHWDVPRWGAGCHFDWNYNLTFARVLKERGYATAAAGKWQINDFRVQPKAMKHHGFDEWCMWTGFESDNRPSSKRYWDPYIHTNEGSKTYKGEFGPDVFTDFLIDFMTRNKEAPMLLYFPMCLTHGPLVSTPGESGLEEKMDKFKAMVGHTDKLVGRLIEALSDLGIREKTYVFFTTDNGTSGGITGRMNGRAVKGGKGRISENGIREPFIVSCPGAVPEGAVTDALTDFTDLFPTFLELAGKDLPSDIVLDGRSIAKVILGAATDSPRDWIMAMGGGVAVFDGERVHPAEKYAHRALRDKRYKIWLSEKGTTHLFDLLKDPGEETNLIETADPDLVSARKRLETIASTFPEKDASPRYDPTPPQPWDRQAGVIK